MAFMGRRSEGRPGIVLVTVCVLLSVAPSCRPTTEDFKQATAVAPLLVGTSGDYAPFSGGGRTGALRGLDIDAARRLAGDFERPLDFVPLRWPDLVAQLRGREFQVAMSGVTIRRDRALHLRFSRPYVITGAVAVIRAADRARFSSLRDLDDPGVRVLVNRGGHLERVARKHLEHAEIRTVQANEELPLLLAHRGGDAAISESFEASTWAGEFAVIGPFTRDRKAYAVAGDAVDLWRALNNWVAAREEDGFLNDIRRRWLGETAVMTPQQACFEAIAAAVELRLSFMPLVAAVKKEKGLPIEVPAQEARVLRNVRQAAEAAGLHADDVVRVFRVLLRAAKDVQYRAEASAGTSGVRGPTDPPADLPQLRRGIAGASEALVVEMARCRGWLTSPPERPALESVLRQGVRVDGQPADLVAGLVSALTRLRRASEVPTPALSG